MTKLTTGDAIRMVSYTSARLRTASGLLSQLDAVAGDGDHGVNMAAAFADADDRLSGRQPASPGGVFLVVAESCRERGGGSAGALFGALFDTIGRTLGDADAPALIDLVEGLDLAARTVASIGHAQSGDKTMLDALLPAIDAARASPQDIDAHSVLAAAATAAEQGAESTARMTARLGRARYATARAMGSRDPGAVSVAVMLRAWADAMAVAAGGRTP